MQHYGDNFIPVIPDTIPIHTKEHPFCGDPTCICYEDKDAISDLSQAIKDGLITTDDATRIIKGKTV
jgi:hypothetical protein